MSPDRRSSPEERADVAARVVLAATLVGRDQLMHTLLAAWHAVRAGQSRHFRIIGEQGMGKTRFLGDAAKRLAAPDARVVFLTATQGERRVAGSFIGKIMGALLALPGAPVRATAATLEGAGGDERVRRLIVGVTDLVTEVAKTAPLALLMDDMHWVDPESRAVIAGVSSRLMNDRVLLVISRRPRAEPVISRADTTELVLEPLSPADVTALIESLGALPGEPWAQSLALRVHASSRGAPLQLLETLQLAIERNALTLREGRWICPDDRALDAVLTAGGSGGALRARIDELPANQQWILLILSIAGTSLTDETLTRVAPRSGRDLASDLDALERRGLVRRSHEGWTVRHDAVGGMARDLAAAGAIRAAHLAMGSALAASPASDRDAELRAGEHLAAAHDERALGELFTRWVRSERARGSARPLTELARDLVGTDYPGSAIPSLLRALPLPQRIGLDSPALLGTAIVLVLFVAVAIAFGIRRGSAPQALGPDSTLVFPAESAASVLSEDWTHGFAPEWSTYGDPPPALTTGPGEVHAFWNRGDGRYASGVYTARTFDASHGLGVEARVSTPLTDAQFQSIGIVLDGRIDSTKLTGWDGKKGYVPRDAEAFQAHCQLAIPGFEGSDALHLVSAQAGSEIERIEHPSPGNTWYTARVQIFPDGRCGVAIDGERRFVSTHPIPMNHRFRVVIGGNSVSTRMLAGPVDAWTGVKGGVDWTLVPHRAATSGGR